MGRRTPVCVCATCGDILLFQEGRLIPLVDEWFENFKVSQAEYDE